MKVLQQFVELNPKESGNVINIFRDETLDPKEWIVLDGTVCIDDHPDGKIRFIRKGFKVKYRFTYRGNTCKMFTFNSKTKLTKKKKKREKNLSQLLICLLLTPNQHIPIILSYHQPNI